MNWCRSGFFAGLLLLGTLVAPTEGQARAACAFANLDEAKAMAERAAAYLEREGPEKALPAFMDPTGPFMDRDLYVFVVDLEGNMWVNGRFPGLIGSNILGAVDQDGTTFGRDMLDAARSRGEGWVEYQWYNPCTQRPAHKVTYFKRVGDFIVAVGAYGTVSA